MKIWFRKPCENGNRKKQFGYLRKVTRCQARCGNTYF